jgi:hypothetical protein
VNVSNSSLPITGNVKVTNTSLPIAGSVSIANTPLPVTGTVTAGNLPLDTNGNVRTSVAPDTTQYQFQSILGQEVAGCTNSYGPDFCAYVNGLPVPIEQVLATLSSQGYEFVSVIPIQTGGTNVNVLYTLRAPLTGAAARK